MRYDPIRRKTVVWSEMHYNDWFLADWNIGFNPFRVTGLFLYPLKKLRKRALGTNNNNGRYFKDWCCYLLINNSQSPFIRKQWHICHVLKYCCFEIYTKTRWANFRRYMITLHGWGYHIFNHVITAGNKSWNVLKQTCSF